jgi:hypothetical protein
MRQLSGRSAMRTRERQRRERDEAKEEAARQKERERRQGAIDKAQAALNTAEEKHSQRVAGLRVQIEAIEKTLNTANADWDKEEGRLKEVLRRARNLGMDP